MALQTDLRKSFFESSGIEVKGRQDSRAKEFDKECGKNTIVVGGGGVDTSCTPYPLEVALAPFIHESVRRGVWRGWRTN
jgi:hypothetical protein